jgi:hypothetical protein
LLQDLINEAGLPVFLKIDELAPGAGDPLARVETTVMRIAQQSRRRTAPAACFVMLDTDQIAIDRQGAEKPSASRPTTTLRSSVRNPASKRCCCGICLTERHTGRPTAS